MKTSNKLFRLRAMMTALNLDNGELAEVSGVGQPHLSSLLTGKADSAAVKPETWAKIITGLVQVMQAEPERFLPIKPG